MNRHHVTVTIPTHKVHPGMEISRYHFSSRYAAVTYAQQINARPPYAATVEECAGCPSFDITAEPDDAAVL